MLCGLYNRVRDTAAFYQLLSFSSWHLAILRNDKKNVSALQYAARANRELQRQIGDPVMCDKVDLMMAVLVFASSSVRLDSQKSISYKWPAIDPFHFFRRR